MALLSRRASPSSGQEGAGRHAQDISGLAQIAQVHVVVTKILEILIVPAPDLGSRRFAAPPFAHFAHELVIRHIQLCGQFLNPAAHLWPPCRAAPHSPCARALAGPASQGSRKWNKRSISKWIFDRTDKKSPPPTLSEP